MAVFQAYLISGLVFSIISSVFGQYEDVSVTCPDPSYRNPYDPRMGFNTHLGNREYPLHPRNTDIVRRIVSNINLHKVSFSRKVPIYVIEEPSSWDTYDVIYKSFSTTNVWTTFRCPPAELIGDEVGKSIWDGSEDWPFIIFDPQHPTHGPFVELRGFHTYIDHASKTIYCEGCGLFKYNNNGTILNPDGMTISDGTDFDGQGTGCGLSWPGVIRRDDVLSGVISHAIRIAFSSCDFLDTTYVPPAVKTDQPKGVSAGDMIPDIEKVEMGYRLRLAPDTDCDVRLAPMYENGGTWNAPTQQHTDFVRMFCIAMREYGGILSDGSGGCKSTIFQGENDITANWRQVFGSDIDESTASWSYLIRDYTTPADTRYRDERYGIPWHKLQVLNNSMAGEVNNCCLNGSQCASTPSPTYVAYVDTEPGPQCLNENCCFKNRIINTSYPIRIADDDCVVYNCTFYGGFMTHSDMISIYSKKDGSAAFNTLIDSNLFYVGTDMDAVGIKHGENTYIYNNWFSDTVSSNYAVVRIQRSLNGYVVNNTFTGSVDTKAIKFEGTSILKLTSNVNTYIHGNIFHNVDYGVSIDYATNTQIINNEFRNISSDGVGWKYYAAPINQSNGVIIRDNTFINQARGIYVGYDVGAVIIDNNIITTTTRAANGNGIEFSGFTKNAQISNNIISDIKHNCITINVGNDDMDIINNQLFDCKDNYGININSDNYLIKGNIIYNVAQTLPSKGRAIYVKSYGTIDGNLIYNTSERAISTSGDYASLLSNEIIIENNIIYATAEDSIVLYRKLYSPQTVIVRFNTVINSALNWYALFIDSNFINFKADIYCNIFVATATSRHFSDRSFNNEYNNLVSLVTNISSIYFINETNCVNLHLQTISPAIAYCNNLNFTRFPLPAQDYDTQIRRQEGDIDAGADQRSPIVPTLRPTSYPSKSPTHPTLQPTLYPIASNTETPTSAPTDHTGSTTASTVGSTTKDTASTDYAQRNSNVLTFLLCLFFAVQFICT